MRWLNGYLLAIVIAASACGAKAPAAPSPPPADSFDPVLASRIDSLVADHLKAAAVPGVSVAVMRGGGSMHKVAIGLADEDTERTVVTTDKFRVGSITKTFVASIVLQLEEEGALSLDDPLDHWVPGFSLGDAVTLRRLLSHTSGVFNFTDDPAFLGRATKAATPEEIIRWALDHGPVFAPGTDYSYSNTNFLLLGLTIENVTGQRFSDVLHQRLLGPLALDDVWFEGGTSVPTVEGFLSGDSTGAFDISWAWTAGGMDATASGLCRWAQALYGGGEQVLKSARLAEMLSPTPLPGGRQASYGLGADLQVRGGRQVVGHTGSTMGFKGELFFDRANGDCVAILTNDFFGHPTEISLPIWDALTK